MTRSFILKADATVPTPRWCHLRAERQERRGHDELHFLVDREPNLRLGEAALLAGLARQGGEPRNRRLGKDVLPLPIAEGQILQWWDSPHQPAKELTDTILVARDEHGFIHGEGHVGVLSWVWHPHRLPATTGSEDPGDLAFQGHRERSFTSTIHSQGFRQDRSRPDEVPESGKLGITICCGAHGDGNSMWLVA